MTRSIILPFVLFILGTQMKTFSQNNQVHSLLALLKTDNEDTLKILHLDDLCWEYQGIGQYDSAIYYGNKTRELSESISSVTKNPIVKKAAQRGIANAYNVMGVSYLFQGNYPKALKNNLMSLKTFEESGIKKGIAASLGNVGLAYYRQGNYSKALDYHLRALKINDEIGARNNIALNLNNIALVYYELKDYPEALKYFFRALKLSEELEDNFGMALNLNNIANVYKDENAYPEALEYYFKALPLNEELGDRSGAALNFCNIGSLYTAQKKYAEAESYLLRALSMHREIGSLEGVLSVYANLSKLYLERGDYRKAFEHQQQYISIKDSIFSIEKERDMTRQEMNFEFQKKEAASNAEREKERGIALAEKKRQRTIIISVSVGLILLSLLAGLIFYNLQQNKKKNKIISEKKKEVEEKNKEIIDSINYAKRIQEVMLPSASSLSEILPQSFILFKPKDVVSGDFYWFSKKNGRVLVTAADCTGHGVPGALMSMIGSAFLNEIVNEKGITFTAEILNELRNKIKNALKQTGEVGESKDGMDMALLSFNDTFTEVEFSGANNPGWIFRNDSSELIFTELNPDKMPVGYYSDQSLPFSSKKFSLRRGDTIYVFTDGFADQFGGEKGKKFKSKNLFELLTKIQSLAITEQKVILENTFESWKGKLEQVDDVCVIGIRV